MSPSLMLVPLVSWILVIVAGRWFGASKVRKAPAIWLAVLLGWIGVLLAATCLKTPEAEEVRRAEARLRGEQPAQQNMGGRSRPPCGSTS